MLIMILQKMFEICRLGYYCVIDTLQLVLCAEYVFCIEFVACVQCTLKSHVRPQSGDGIQFKN